jgi:hypothetical protein
MHGSSSPICSLCHHAHHTTVGSLVTRRLVSYCAYGSIIFATGCQDTLTKSMRQSWVNHCLCHCWRIVWRCIPFTTNSCSWALKFAVQIQKFKPHMVVRHKVLTIYSCSFVRATTDFFFKLGLKVPRLKILENTYQGSLDNRHVKFVWFEPVAQARPFYQLKKRHVRFLQFEPVGQAIRSAQKTKFA